MIKIYSTAILLLVLSGSGFAQKTEFGVQAGVNAFARYVRLDGKNYASNLKPGLQGGVNAQIELTPAFFLQPGLMIVSKGSAEENDQARVNVQYVEVPISLLHKSRLGNGKLVVGAGPYFAVAVDGNYSYKDSVGNRKVKFDNDISPEQARSDMYLRRFDAGFNVLAGLEFASKLFFQLNGQLGLLSTSPKFSGESYFYKQKNIGVGCSLGYRF